MKPRRSRPRSTRRPWTLALPAAAAAGLLVLAVLAIFPSRVEKSPAPPASPAPVSTAQAPSAYRELRPAGDLLRVLDGDTFELELDGDGRLELPRERVRLLFVDAPELSPSGKGQDRAHGLPAKAFLEAAMRRRPLRLLVPRTQPTGKYGRTLALVEAGGASVNLALIRAGHAYFDTRFGFPDDYRAYQSAEGEAFDAGRGIWAEGPSRKRYLARLKRELKTPAGATNPAYRPGRLAAESFDPQDWRDRYVHLEGRLAGRRELSKGVRLLLLDRGAGRKPFPAVAFRRTAERLGAERWPTGRTVQVEGFVQTYRKRWELAVHYGRVLP